MDHSAPIRAFLNENHIAWSEEASGRECTTFRVGGPIALFAEPDTFEKACSLLSFVRDNGVPFYLIGNGSNLLIRDHGLDKLVIRLAGELSEYRLENDRLICGAGASLVAASRYSVLSGWTGLEWATGIPGSVGGAVAMNAGAYGGEIKNVLKRVKAFSNGELLDIEVDPDSMGYRISPFAFPKMTVLEAEFELVPDDGSAKLRMDELTLKRREKQPLNYPSAGSTFKRPKGNFAGALIENAGLKGLTVGGAQVSEKHAGFLINTGEATADDVLGLIAEVQRIVFEKYGVMLEPEVKILD